MRATIMALAAIASADDVGKRQRADPAIARLVTNVEQHRGDAALYELVGGVLYRTKDGINDEVRRALVIPSADRPALLTAAHDDMSAGHLGIAKTFDRLRRVAWCPGIHGDVRDHVRSCECESADAATCASAFIELVVSRHGVPRQLVSDRGTPFLSDLMDDLFARLGVRYTPSTAYHQQTDAQTERFVQTLTRMLRTCLDHQYAHWDALLPLLLFAYRTAMQSSTGVTPALVVCGRELVTPVEALIGMLPTELAPVDEHVEQLQQLLCNIHGEVLDNLDAARAQQADGYDKGRREVEYKVGDLVWVRQEKSGKFGQSWYGRMRVDRSIASELSHRRRRGSESWRGCRACRAFEALLPAAVVDGERAARVGGRRCSRAIA